jgi:hypothetical protein
LRTQAVGMKSCRPRSGLLTWHPSASTADSLLFTALIGWTSYIRFLWWGLRLFLPVVHTWMILPPFRRIYLGFFSYNEFTARIAGHCHFLFLTAGLYSLSFLPDLFRIAIVRVDGTVPISPIHWFGPLPPLQQLQGPLLSASPRRPSSGRPPCTMGGRRKVPNPPVAAEPKRDPDI